MLEKLYEMLNGIDYTRDVPEEAKQLAKDNGYIIVVGGSDDLMYCYGADSWLSEYVEHSYGWDGDTLKDIDDELLRDEAKQLGLEIYWCGKIVNTNKEILGYDTEKQGAFSYVVSDDIVSKDFIVYENDKKNEVYCTGKIIKLPKDFKRSEVK